MRRAFVLLCASAIASVVFAGSASAATLSDVASLTRHGEVVVGQPISANLNFHARFASIDSACFFFTFQGDLLDPGEAITVGFRGTVDTVGQENVFQDPLADVAFCVVPDVTGFLDHFLDGKEKLVLSMTNGSVKLAGLEVVIEGT